MSKINKNDIIEMVQEEAVIDQKPTLAGTIITMMLDPKNAK